MEKEECIQIMMIQDKIIAAQQECEEACLQRDTPDYRMLYFRLFARMEEVRKLLGAEINQNKKPPLRGRGSGQLRLPADVEQRPEQTGKQAWAAVNYNLHTVTPPFGK